MFGLPAARPLILGISRAGPFLFVLALLALPIFLALIGARTRWRCFLDLPFPLLSFTSLSFPLLLPALTFSFPFSVSVTLPFSLAIPFAFTTIPSLTSIARPFLVTIVVGSSAACNASTTTATVVEAIHRGRRAAVTVFVFVSWLLVSRPGGYVRR